MFISPNKSGQINTKRVDSPDTLQNTPIREREQRRYQYLFHSSPLHGNKSLYKHVVKLVNQFLNQVIGRQGAPETETQNQSINEPRQVRGIADRTLRVVDPTRPNPHRDSIFLGEARDYPAAVIAIEYGNSTKPVFYEGNQVVARHLNLDSEAESISGNLILNDGSRLPIEIIIFTAV